MGYSDGDVHGEHSVVLQWYLVGQNVWSIGGMGMIDKDFHDRKDFLRVYLEETEWGHGGHIIRRGLHRHERTCRMICRHTLH